MDIFKATKAELKTELAKLWGEESRNAEIWISVIQSELDRREVVRRGSVFNGWKV